MRGSLFVKPGVKDELGSVEANLDPVVEESKERAERKRGHKTRYEPKL